MHFIVIKQNGRLRPSAHNLPEADARHRLDELRRNGVYALMLAQDDAHPTPEAAVCRECGAALMVFLQHNVEAGEPG